MLNLAGREYDFGPVLFAVLQECEHRRRSLPADDGEAAAKLAEMARQKLAEIEVCYVEAAGTPGYWRELTREVLETALPQYARTAADQTRLELASYGLWRQGDPLSRVLLGLGGLAIGGLIVKAPFIPIFEDAFAFLLAAGAFFYPEIRRWFFDRRYGRFLNRLIVQAESYQHRQLPYVSEAELQAELHAVGALGTLGTLGTDGAQKPAATPSAFRASPLSILPPPGEEAAPPAGGVPLAGGAPIATGPHGQQAAAPVRPGPPAATPHRHGSSGRR